MPVNRESPYQQIGWGRANGGLSSMVVMGRVHRWDAGDAAERKTLCGVDIPGPVARQSLGLLVPITILPQVYPMHPSDFEREQPCKRCEAVDAKRRREAR